MAGIVKPPRYIHPKKRQGSPSQHSKSVDTAIPPKKRKRGHEKSGADLERKNSTQQQNKVHLRLVARIPDR
ncbi:hypothetical protein MJD09_15640, partial [bacterium]|nr:hypothetical protein [bacterium]